MKVLTITSPSGNESFKATGLHKFENTTEIYAVLPDKQLKMIPRGATINSVPVYPWKEILDRDPWRKGDSCLLSESPYTNYYFK